MDIYTLIDQSKLSKHDKASLKMLYKRHEKILRHMPLETQLHELIHYFRGDHYIRRECQHCYVHNLIADYQVEKFISENWPTLNRSVQLSKLIEQLRSLKLTGEYRDLLHWDCSKCPFKQTDSYSETKPRYMTSIEHRCIHLRYLLERLIKQIMPKVYIGITHRNYVALQQKKKVFTIMKKTRNEKLNIIIDTSTSIPLVLIQTAIDAVWPFTYNPNITLYGFSDICYKLTEDNIRYKDATHFQPVYNITKDDRYNIVITDLQFDDFDLPLPRNYKILEVGKVI